jgi:hypothetical protein
MVKTSELQDGDFFKMVTFRMQNRMAKTSEFQNGDFQNTELDGENQ